MACCGQKRSSQVVQGALKPSARTTGNVPAPAPFASFADGKRASPVVAPSNFGTVAVRYLARPAIVVRGSATGQQYRFSAAHALQHVARADLDPLLGTGYFRREF